MPHDMENPNLKLLPRDYVAVSRTDTMDALDDLDTLVDQAEEDFLADCLEHQEDEYQRWCLQLGEFNEEVAQ